MSVKIGITERGDAGLDLSWVDKLAAVDGAVIITKAPCSPMFQEVMLKNVDKTVLHATVTGYGDTPIEPNVPPSSRVFRCLHNLIAAGYPAERVVLRVDPIIPDEDGIGLAEHIIRKFCINLGIRRVRVSVLDMYPHARNRFVRAGIDVPYGNRFQASADQFAAVDEMLARCKDLGPLYANVKLSIEACAEPNLHNAEHVGCIGPKEYAMFGLPLPETSGFKQRRDCLCLAGKTELLENRRQCPHGCLYCYWKNG